MRSPGLWSVVTMSIVRLVWGRFSVSDESGQGVVELGQGLDEYREAGVPVVSHGVQRQPGQRVVSLQHEPEEQQVLY